MHASISHLADYQLVQKSLEGQGSAVSQMREKFLHLVAGFLIRAGADESEAYEITESVWAECLLPVGERAAALAQYDGDCALGTLLNKIALNKLLTLRRLRERWERIAPSASAGETDEVTAPLAAASRTDPPILELMRTAIEAAFASCTPEQFVLLQLVHSDRLRLAELALIFHCDQSTISRRLDAAAHAVAAATMAHIKERDPWLELTWEDFLEFCRTTGSPACFGLE